MRSHRRPGLTAPTVAAFTLALLGSPLAGIPAAPTALADGPSYIPLQLWWSPSRTDFYTTSDPAWGPDSGVHAPDYYFFGTLGLVIAPSEPAPPDGKMLYGWFNAARGDHFITNDAYWSGRVGDVREGYTLVRYEGYAFRRAYMGTIPLYHWYSGELADNLTTSDNWWAGRAGDRRSPGYSFVRLSGYVVRDGSERSWANDVAFGLGRMGPKGARGQVQPNLGERPLLAIMVAFSDMPNFRPAHTEDYYRGLLFGGRLDRNISDYFREVSNGQFWYSAGSVVGIFQAPDDPKTGRVDESTRACAIEGPVPCPGGPKSNVKLAFKALEWAAKSRNIDFLAWDDDGNNQITDDELAVLLVWPNTPPADGGASRPSQPVCTKPDGVVEVCLRFGFFDESAGFATIAHELSHSFSTLDIYGSYGNSTNLSLMGATMFSREDVMASTHLDPWHKMALAWARPRMYDLRAPGDCVAMDAQSLPSSTPWIATPHDPLLFYDRHHGRREYFMADFRRPSGTGISVYDDANVLPGVALWHVKVDASLIPQEIPGLRIDPGDDRVLNSVVALGSDDEYLWSDDGTMRVGLVAGADRVLQSVVHRRDTLWSDRFPFLFGPPAGRRGEGTWTSANGPARLRWYNGTSSGHSVLVGPIGPLQPRTWIEWNPGRTPPRLDTASVLWVSGDRELWVTGSLGVRAGAHRLVLSGPGGIFRLTTATWACNRANAAIPDAVGEGDYLLYIDPPGNALPRSNMISVSIP